MIEDTIKELEERIKNASSIPKHKKQELTSLLVELKSEILKLAKTKGEAAESIAGFTKLSTYEAMRRDKNQKLLDLSLKGLNTSIGEFEGSHPRLAQMVRSISEVLVSLGI